MARRSDPLDTSFAERIAVLESLRSADRLLILGRVASSLAHELGTPLNIVSGRASMIASGDLEREEIAKNAKIIKEQVERMTKSLQEVLRFARRGSPELVELDLAATVAEALDVVEPLAARAGVALKLEPASETITVRANRLKVSQLVTSLATNAITATPEGGEVAVRLTKEHRAPPPREQGRAATGEYAVIAFEDQGGGLGEEALVAQLDPWLRRGPDEQAARPAGLGLAVSHSVTRDHRGWLAAEPRPAGGSVVRAYLPLQQSSKGW